MFQKSFYKYPFELILQAEHKQNAKKMQVEWSGVQLASLAYFHAHGQGSIPVSPILQLP